MILKNTTILSGEEAIEEIVLTSKKYYYKKYIFSGLLLLVGIITLAVVLSLGNEQDSTILGYLFIAFGFSLAAINTYSIASIKRRTQKQNPALAEKGLTNSFTFKEESFQRLVKIGSKVNRIEYPYTALKQIIEHEDRISFVISALEIYICKKSAFQNPKDVEQFFYGLSKHKIKVKKKLSK